MASTKTLLCKHRSGMDQYIGLPPRSLTIRNSVRTKAACPRRWLFAEGERLVPDSTGRALSYGRAWHILLEEVHSYWMNARQRANVINTPPYEPDMVRSTECPICTAPPDIGGVAVGRHLPPERCLSCGGTGLSAYRRVQLALQGTDYEHEVDTLAENLEGWLTYHGWFPPRGMSVAGVEVPLAMPIINPANGRVLRTNAFVVVDARGNWRRARRGEVHAPPPGCTVHDVKLPVYLTGVLDVVYGVGGHNAIYTTTRVVIGEHKSSDKPRQWLSKLSLDPQVTVYQLLLAYAASTGAVGHRRLRPVQYQVRSALHDRVQIDGSLYNVTCSKPLRDVFWLKSGKFSRSKQQLVRVPRDRIVDALRKEASNLGLGEPDLSSSPVLSLLAQAAEQESAHFQMTDMPRATPEQLGRERRQLYALAREQAAMWRQAATLQPGFAGEPEADNLFPRRPVCRSEFGTCAYAGPCTWDDFRFSRNGLVVNEPLHLAGEPEPDDLW